MNALCVIPSWNGGEEIKLCLQRLKEQELRCPIAVIDSQSQDGSWEWIQGQVDFVHQIPQKEFNHGLTRQLAIELWPDYDFYVFLTQDAWLAHPSALHTLLRNFENPLVGGVYGRQLPKADATVFAAFARFFNYPDKKEVRDQSFIQKKGIKAAFFSNSFGAYRRQALLEVGGFPPVRTGEDTVVAAKMLLKGWKVVFEPDALCYHSHNLNFKQEWKRYFETGRFHKEHFWLLQTLGRPEGEGLRYLIEEFLYLAKNYGFRGVFWWPESFLRCAIRYLAYRQGLSQPPDPRLMSQRSSESLWRYPKLKWYK